MLYVSSFTIALKKKKKMQRIFQKTLSQRHFWLRRPHCLSQLAHNHTQNTLEEEDDFFVPKISHFDYIPPPYIGPSASEILEKRKEYLSPSICTLEFASDVAHKRWWMVHDAMPEKLQKFCLLRSKQKAALEWDRRQVEKGNYTDGHWKIKIKDKRLKTCFEDFCFWEIMLWHWGEKNWTDTATVTPALPVVTTKSLSSL